MNCCAGFNAMGDRLGFLAGREWRPDSLTYNCVLHLAYRLAWGSGTLTTVDQIDLLTLAN